MIDDRQGLTSIPPANAPHIGDKLVLVKLILLLRRPGLRTKAGHSDKTRPVRDVAISELRLAFRLHHRSAPGFQLASACAFEQTGRRSAGSFGRSRVSHR